MNFKNKPSNIFSALIITTLMLTALLVSPTSADMPDSNVTTPADGIVNGQFEIAVWSDGAWQAAGLLAFNQNFDQQQVDLSAFALTDPVQVRVTHSGATAAHIDTLTFGGHVPTDVQGAAESPALVAKKLAARNYDVIDATGKSLGFFNSKANSPTFTVRWNASHEKFRAKKRCNLMT